MSYSPKNPNGQATMANSEPVVLASDHSDLKVTLDGEAIVLPTGAATSANQSTIIGHLDGVEGLLTTIDADTGNISTKIDTIAGAVAGAEMQVDVVTLPSVTIGSLPNEGQQTMANSISVVVASDQSAIPVSGTVTANLAAGTNNIGDVDVLTLPSIPAGNNNIGDVDVLSVPAPLSTTGGGTEATALRVTLANDSTGVVSVDDNGGALTVDAVNLDIRDLAFATDKVDISGSTVTAQIEGLETPSFSVQIAGDVVSGGVDSGFPVKIGMKAETTLPAAVDDGDRVDAVADVFGRQLVSHIPPTLQVWKSANYTTTQTGTAIWTPAAGKKIALTSLTISSYGSTAGRVIVWFGGAGDTTYSAGTDQLVWAGSFAASATQSPGMILSLSTPIFAATADHVLRITTDAAISLDLATYGYEF